MARSINLDAARREATEPDGIPITFKGTEYTVPAELPADVFDPFLLNPDIDLSSLIRALFDKTTGDDGEELGIGEKVVEVLLKQPNLPVATYKAFHDALDLLSGLFEMYGASLGEALASFSSSTSDGATQKETSTDTTESTPAKSGAARAKQQGS